MAATPNRQFKNICVLSGFTYGKHKEFVEAAIDLGRSIAARKLHLVYGGGNRGLSKMVSEAAFIRGSQVLGIIPRALKPLGSSSDSSTGEELVVSGMQERITEMFNHADAFIFLPRDLATLEALITLASWAHLHIHQKPIGLLNVNNFYDGFIAFLNHEIKNYFIPSNAKKLFIYAHTANELLDMLQAYRPEPDPWTFVLEHPNNDGNSSRNSCACEYIKICTTTRGLSLGPLHHGQRWRISSSVVTSSKSSVPHSFMHLVARSLTLTVKGSKPSVPYAHNLQAWLRRQRPRSLTLTLTISRRSTSGLTALTATHHSARIFNLHRCRVQDNLDCVADDFEHEVEVNDNKNDSATIVTGGNKWKKSSSSKPPLLRKQMAPRSTVWQHFTRVPNDHTKCKCNYSGQEFECGTVGYGTSTLRTHNRERCQKFKDLQKNQTTLTQDVGSDEVVGRGFSQEACRRATMKMIVLDELPFSIVENPGFRHFCSVAAPRYLLSSRRTITSYMVITAHFIDRDWNLHRKIISFNTVNDHSSETIGKQLEKCLIDWGIERVFTVTVDNASPNEGALRYLIDRVKTWRGDGLVLNGDYLHVRCCAHILNLIITEGLKKLEQSIVSVQNVAKYVRSSTARMQAFQIRVQQEKINCRGSVILDCPTRWNSTYSMLNTALKFKPAFDRMALEDKLYDAYFNEKEGGKKKKEGPPLYSDWENTQRIVKFLKTFHDATLQFSSSLKVTSNICYNLISQTEQSLGSLSASNDSLLGFKAIKMKENFNKYWDGCFKINKLLIVASILDPSGSASGSLSRSQNLAIGSGSGSNFWDLGDDDDVMIEDPFSEFSKAVAVSEARDVLAIPVSTVASKSAFSTGGRILDQYRSSLTPDMVEALVLLQNWLRTSLFVDTTADLNKLVEDNEFMDQLAEELCKSTTADQLCRRGAAGGFRPRGGQFFGGNFGKGGIGRGFSGNFLGNFPENFPRSGNFQGYVAYQQPPQGHQPQMTPSFVNPQGALSFYNGYTPAAMYAGNAGSNSINVSSSTMCNTSGYNAGVPLAYYNVVVD
ncbi:BED-type domain-containing protein [Citrus sinensis]|nr:BED-type domain-containing protein [Citrus sinensis]